MEDSSKTAAAQKPKSSPALSIIIALLIIILFILGGIIAVIVFRNNPSDSAGAPDRGEESDIEQEGQEEDVEDGESGGTGENEDTGIPVGETQKIKVYFYKGPFEPMETEVTDVHESEREVPEGESSLYSFAMNQLLAGPTAEDIAQGYVLPFSVSGASTCGYTYEYKMPGAGLLKLRICKDIEPRIDNDSGYAGSSLKAAARVIYSIKKTLTFGDVSSVAVYDKDGACYMPDTGENACSYGDTY